MAIKKYHVSKNIINSQNPTETARTTVTSLSNGGIELSISNVTWTQCRYTNIPVVANVEYTLSIYIDEYSGTGTFMIPFRQIDGNGTVISTDTITQTGMITHKFTAEGSTVWLGVYLNNSGTAATANAKIRIMLNVGSTALPYEAYDTEVWHTIGYKKYETATDTYTSLPQTIIGDGTALSAWSMKGNMSQSGTPTPSNPVYPQETGEKTANLFDDDNAQSGYLTSTGTVVEGHQNLRYTDYLSIPSGISNITQSWTDEGATLMNAPSMCFYSNNKTFISGEEFNNGNPKTFSVPVGAAYVRTCYRTFYTDVVLNEGNTALPYEPFGYKIPILSNGVAYPIYLSEPIRKIGESVDTAPSSGTASRVIKTISYDGTETWSSAATTQGGYRFYCSAKKITDADLSQRMSFICTHFAQNSGDWNRLGFTVGTDGNIFYVVSDIDNTTDWKAWLAELKSNGTPLTTYYVLATAETETFTAPTIPTSGTAQTFDVDTTLKPSEVSLTYHGWHEHEDTKFTT